MPEDYGSSSENKNTTQFVGTQPIIPKDDSRVSGGQSIGMQTATAKGDSKVSGSQFVGITTEPKSISKNSMVISSKSPLSNAYVGMLPPSTDTEAKPIEKKGEQTSRVFRSSLNIFKESYYNRLPSLYRKIYVYISDNPDKSISEIATATGSKEYEVKYVIEWLENNGIISGKESSGTLELSTKDINKQKSWSEVKTGSNLFGSDKLEKDEKQWPALSIWTM